MVRLKGGTTTSVMTSPEFQFHNGAIKSDQGQEEIANLMYFNSIMVRLKEKLLNMQFLTWKFQFHNGAIKSMLR